MDKLLPRLTKLQTEATLPIRLSERKEIEEPRATKSSTEKAEPAIAKVRRDNEDPKPV
jgi:hypothetical protein